MRNKPTGPDNERISYTICGIEREYKLKKGGIGILPSPPATPQGRKYNSFGVRVDRPSTTEHLTAEQKIPSTMEPMSVFVFFAFMFCAFSLGVAVGGICGN